MLFLSQKTASLLYGFNRAPHGRKYPCTFCGVLTDLLDPEHLFVCAEHQREHAEVGFEEMERRYPLRGKDERNPEFFKAETERNLARGKRLRRGGLKLLIERGCGYDIELAQKRLSKLPLEDHELEHLGMIAEDYIDSIPWWFNLLLRIFKPHSA